VYTVPYQQQVPWTGGGWVPPGQIRSQQVHERNAERKALKDQEKAYRRYMGGGDDRDDERDNRRYYGQRWQNRIPQIYQNYNPNQYGYDPRVYRYQQPAPVYPYQPGGGYYAPNQYYPNTYGYNQDPYYYGGYPNQYGGGSLKSTIVRMLLSNVLGNVLGGGRNSYLNQYDPYAYGPVNYSYNQPAYLGGGYAPQYASYGVPQYGGYSPYSGGLLGASPLGGLLGQGGGGSYITQALSQVLAQGYLQGMLAGQNARQGGYGDRYYNDPYNTAASSYCPYSTSMDQNRQLLSEGYNLGFQDALSGRNPYQPQSYGKADLVSLLLSNVLRAG